MSTPTDPANDRQALEVQRINDLAELSTISKKIAAAQENAEVFEIALQSPTMDFVKTKEKLTGCDRGMENWRVRLEELAQRVDVTNEFRAFDALKVHVDRLHQIVDQKLADQNPPMPAPTPTSSRFQRARASVGRGLGSVRDWGSSLHQSISARWTARKARRAVAAAAAPTTRSVWWRRTMRQSATFAAAVTLIVLGIWLINNRPVSPDEPVEASTRADKLVANQPAPTPPALVPAVPTAPEDSAAVKALAGREAQLQGEVGQMKTALAQQPDLIVNRLTTVFDQRFAPLKSQIEGVVKTQTEMNGKVAALDQSVGDLKRQVAGVDTQVTNLNTRVGAVETKSSADIATLRQEMVKKFSDADKATDAKIEALKRSKAEVNAPPILSPPDTKPATPSPNAPEVNTRVPARQPSAQLADENDPEHIEQLNRLLAERAHKLLGAGPAGRRNEGYRDQIAGTSLDNPCEPGYRPMSGGRQDPSTNRLFVRCISN